jgi:hypothetical protein
MFKHSVAMGLHAFIHEQTRSQQDLGWTSGTTGCSRTERVDGSIQVMTTSGTKTTVSPVRQDVVKCRHPGPSARRSSSPTGAPNPQ